MVAEKRQSPTSQPLKNKGTRRGPKGLSKADLLAEILSYLEEGGKLNLSLRAIARFLDCDVATICYHFGSKEELKHALGEAIFASVKSDKDRTLPWLIRLSGSIQSYYRLSQIYPNSFRALIDPTKIRSFELQIVQEWFVALIDSDIRKGDVPAFAMALYASIRGICLLEETDVS